MSNRSENRKMALVCLGLLLTLSLPLLVNAMSIKSRVEISSVELELTENVITETEQTPIMEEDDENYKAETFLPSTISVPLFSSGSHNFEDFPLEEDFIVAIYIPAEEDNSAIELTSSTSTQLPEETSELDTPSLNHFNVFEIYSAEHNTSLVIWNCTEMGESTTTSENCVAKKDIIVGNVFQRVKPLFKTMIGTVNSEDSQITAFVAGTTRDDIVEWINSETEKKVEAIVADGETAPKIRRVKNVTLAIALTLNLEDPEEEIVIEDNLANAWIENFDGGNLADQTDLGEENEGSLGHEDGGSLIQTQEELPTWTQDEVVDMYRWCNVCVWISQRFPTGSEHQVTFLVRCASKLRIRSFDVAICEGPLPKEGDPIESSPKVVDLSY